MIYLFLALLTFVLLYSAPLIARDLPYVQYDPKNARIAQKDRDFIDLTIRVLALCVLILFAGLRSYAVGLDITQFYWSHWEILCESNGQVSNFEYGYALLARLGYFLWGAEYGMSLVLLSCATIIVLCVYFAAKKLSPDVALLMFLMVCCVLYTRGLSTMRQCVAVSLCVLATGFATQKKWRWYLLLIVAALGFHRISAILFAPMLLFVIIKNQWWQLVLWVEICIALVIFISFENQIVKIFCDLIGNDFYYEYYSYNNLGLGTQPGLMNLVDIQVTLGSFVFFVAFKWYYQLRYQHQVSPTYNFLLNIYTCAAVLYLVALVSGKFALYERFTLPFSWAGIFLVTQVLATIKNKTLKTLCQATIMLGALWYLYYLVFAGNHMIYPYRMIE